jgi:hypothetical protein
VVGDFTRDCLCLVADTSLLDAVIACQDELSNEVLFISLPHAGVELTAGQADYQHPVPAFSAQQLADPRRVRCRKQPVHATAEMDSAHDVALSVVG